MTSITIQENGKQIVVTDITPYRSERRELRATLLTIYEGYDIDRIYDLILQEAEIVELYNRICQLDAILSQWDVADAQHKNIRAAFELVKQLRLESEA